MRSALLILFFLFTKRLLKLPASIENCIFSFWPKLVENSPKKGRFPPHTEHLCTNLAKHGWVAFLLLLTQNALYGINFCGKTKCEVTVLYMAFCA